MEQMAEQVAQETTMRTTQARQRWKKWADMALTTKGASIAHKVCKKTDAWTPNPVNSEFGKSACPTHVLEHEIQKWAKTWKTRPKKNHKPQERSRPSLPEEIPDRGFLGGSRPPELKPEEIRAASRLFKNGTAMQVDSINLKHFALLDDPTLEVLAIMFQITDATGLVPKQTARTIMPMLPKKGTGYRLIGLFSAYTRLYNKTWAARIWGVGIFHRSSMDGSI